MKPSAFTAITEASTITGPNEPHIDITVGFDDHTSGYSVPVSVLRGLSRTASAEEIKDRLLDATNGICDNSNHGVFLDCSRQTCGLDAAAEFFSELDAELAAIGEAPEA